MASAGSRLKILAVVLAAVCLLATPGAARADIRIGHLSVFLNDNDVTVQVVLLGAIPPSLHESLHSGIAVHVRFRVELLQQGFFRDRVVQARTVERQLSYSVLTKEYKVASLQGEQREPYLSKGLREAQRVASDLRVSRLAPAPSLDPGELYYVRVRADASLGGVNTWLARATGDAAETEWVQSSLLTVTRSQ
jgi:hypothetical protein